MPQLTVEFAVFTSVVVALFWRLPERARGGALALASALFLGRLDPTSCVALALATAAAYRARRLARQRWVWRGGLIALVVAFAAVKGWEVASQRLGVAAFVVPLGFGFYVPKLIHYWIDADEGPASEHSFLTFFNFMFFFPTVLVGPIHRFDDFARGELRRRWDASLFTEGLRRILYGYFKVVVVANWGVAFVLRGYLLESALPDTRAWVLAECLTYGLYLYSAFAGYSDIAIGLGRLLGQVVGENFRRPFLQPNLAEFWRCWHISLSDWCRRYVFTPVYAQWRRPSIAIVATMLSIGLWHELTARYVLWGFYHGLGLAVHRAYAGWVERSSRAERPPGWSGVRRIAGTLATFTFVIVGFAITKNDTLAAMADDFRILILGGPADAS